MNRVTKGQRTDVLEDRTKAGVDSRSLHSTVRQHSVKAQGWHGWTMPWSVRLGAVISARAETPQSSISAVSVALWVTFAISSLFSSVFA